MLQHDVLGPAEAKAISNLGNIIIKTVWNHVFLHRDIPRWIIPRWTIMTSVTVTHAGYKAHACLLLEVPMDDVLVVNVLQAACKVLQGDQDHPLRILHRNHEDCTKDRGSIDPHL